MAEAASVDAPCEWCLTFAGRTKKGRQCCELRALAAMPKAQRQDVYMRVRREEGLEASEQLKKAVVAEYRRKVEHDEQRQSAKPGRVAKNDPNGNLFA